MWVCVSCVDCGLRPKPTKAYISAYGRCLKINTNCLSVCTRYNVHIIRYRDSILSELKCVGRREGTRTRAHTHTNSFRIHHQINQHKHRHGDWMKRTLHSVASYLFLGILPVVGCYCISVFVFCSFRGVLVDWHGVRSFGIHEFVYVLYFDVYAVNNFQNFCCFNSPTHPNLFIYFLTIRIRTGGDFEETTEWTNGQSTKNASNQIDSSCVALQRRVVRWPTSFMTRSNLYRWQVRSLRCLIQYQTNWSRRHVPTPQAMTK